MLIHGIGSQWQVWEPVFGRLARERDVIAIDLPGFGESPPLDGRPTIPALADAVAAFLRGLGIERPHVAGNSLGGAVSLALGAAGEARSVCCLSPAGFIAGREMHYAGAVLRGSWLLARALAPIAGFVTAGPLRRTLAFWHLTARPWQIPPSEAAGALRGFAASTGFAATLTAAAEWRPRPPACPTTIAWGARDRLLVFSRQAPRARTGLTAARHVTLRGCGHVPTWDDPEQVAGVLLSASSDRPSGP